MTGRRFALAAFALACACGAPRTEREELDVVVRHVPARVYTAVQGSHVPAQDTPPGAHAETQNLTWLFHLVLESNEERPLRVESVDATFLRSGEPLWEERFTRAFLERTEWIEGAFADTTEYFMENIEFRDNHMSSVERAAGPDLAPNQPVSWVRIPFGRPWFADADEVELALHLSNGTAREGVVHHTVPLVRRTQQVALRLPFEGVWAVNAGNDLATGHRRTGLNSLTMYGWDFTKLGANGLPYRTDGATPEDYWSYDEPVLAAGSGVVVDVRNDIEEYGVGETPPREVLENDGDVFAGNLVTIDHGNGEFSLTCHMRAGTIPVKVGDRVEAGQLLGRVGNSGVSQVPHIHFNLMDGGQWLEAKGMPSLFRRFERIRMGGTPLPLELGNPTTGWLVRPSSEGASR